MLFAEWFGALGKHKSTHASRRTSGMGGLLPQSLAGLQARAVSCWTPALPGSHCPILMAYMDMGR